MSKGLRYVGKGWADGIPARDLTAEEVEKYGGAEFLLDIIDANTGRPMYEEAETAKRITKRAAPERVEAAEKEEAG